MKKNAKKRKIAVVTGTRAEYGILKPLLDEIEKSRFLQLELLVSGMHLLKDYGLTGKEIKKDGFREIVKVPMYEQKIDFSYYGAALGQGIKNFIKIFSKTKPDILVILGDRLEPLAAALAAATLRIPIAHIHGGDKTDSGHIDESIRHAITRFAHIHFAPSEKCHKRLLKMGEESWRIYKVGALGLDSVLNTPFAQKKELFNKLKLNPNKKTILCLFHPVHLEAEKMGKQMKEIIGALKKLKTQSLIIYPNNDSGTLNIIGEIKKAENSGFIKTRFNLFHSDYVNLLRYADILIGNSSSGIVEAPSVKLPVVNIGSRNVGREHAENVIYVEAKEREILNAIKKGLSDKNFLKKVKKAKNPWGDGKTSKRIVKTLTEIELNDKLLQKKITY